MFFKELETDRLVLKNIGSEDKDFILKQFSDDTVNQYLFDAEPLNNLEEANELINFYIQPEPRTQHRWILILKDNGIKIGTCGFHCWNKNNSSVEIGYDLQRQYWGQGLMTEALQAILLFALQDMGVNKIDAHIYTGNKKSITLAQRLGFKYNGETEECMFRGKKYLHNIYSLECSAIKRA